MEITITKYKKCFFNSNKCYEKILALKIKLEFNQPKIEVSLNSFKYPTSDTTYVVIRIEDTSFIYSTIQHITIQLV